MKTFFQTIGADKYAHFCVCAIVAICVGFFGMLIGMSPMMIGFSGFISAMGAGLGKEYGDKINPYNKWDWYDVLADLLGALAGSGLTALLASVF